MAQAEWSGMVFEVSPGAIRPISTLSAKRSVSVERNEDKEGQPATQSVALDLMTIDVEYDIVRSASGEDPRSVYGAWWNLVGTYAPFYVGGRKFMGDLFLLKSADVSDIEMNTSGEWVMCSIKLQFEEYAVDASGLKKTKGADTSLRAGIMQQTASTAVAVGPTDEQRAGKMPGNPGM